MPKANIAHSSFNREKKDPISWSNAINIVRIVAMLMVINLHTLLNFTQRSDFFLTKLWWLLEPIAILSAAATWIFFF